ncbi:hypothetical protein [Streptomyces albipurpureus]|uniref:Uncharacterized protein n=1 Tax=Streptomyces albipurpureus TaxID=2897419 RepID=A0ABT0UZ71_9ACTN|nr:hypothetical protein [Streptomyces sp. CWNU-1]MCM2393765.1 hypothetical protein [Streptomyces sp. CWNU-1]
MTVRAPTRQPNPRRTRLSVAHVPDSRLMRLLMPPALEAFHTLHSPIYLTYASAHLSTLAAQRAVQTAFGLIAMHWPFVVGCPRPAAVAWSQLVASTGSRGCPLPLTAGCPLQYDAAVLHTRGHDVTAIADATGHDASKIRYLLTRQPA